MWALCPPSYHDNDMPIDLSKKSALEKALDERECYAPRDYSVREYRERWDRLPAGGLYPFVAEKYGTVEPPEDREKPQDLRPVIRGTLETAIKKLHHSKLKQSQENGKEERCRSTDALQDKDSDSLKRPPRSSSCPDLTTIEQKPPSDPHKSTISSNGSVTTEIKNYSEYNDYSPEHEDIHSPVIGGAKKRKSFVPLYGDRAPVYERAYRSPSPQNLVYIDRHYRSPSPKRPIYHTNGYHSPSPENHPYQERIYRSPSPKRPMYIDRHYYSPSPTRPMYEERRYRSPSPKRPAYLERGFRSPSPIRRQKSPTENSPYEEYYSHPGVLVHGQLSQQSPFPPDYFRAYYKELMRRLREHSLPTVRISLPVSPPIEEDTNPDAQRKRPCRALTGKHVRQGTGASLSTLLTLRQKIEERQKAKEHQPRSALNGINKNAGAKKNTPKKVKLNVKSALNKIHNC